MKITYRKTGIILEFVIYNIRSAVKLFQYYGQNPIVDLVVNVKKLLTVICVRGNLRGGKWSHACMHAGAHFREPCMQHIVTH